MPKIFVLVLILAVTACGADKAPVPADAAASADAAAKADAAATTPDAAAAETAGVADTAVVPDGAADGTTVVNDVGPLADAVTAADAAADSAIAPDFVAEVSVIADITAETSPDAAADVPAPADVAADVKVFDIDPKLDVGLLAAPDAVAIPASATNIDVIGVPYTCDGKWQPKLCGAPLALDPPLQPGMHVDLPTPITYADKPPSSGTHRFQWGNWGEYLYMPPQRYLHNLEHGGVVLLYHPCAPKATVEALRALAKAIAPDAYGPARWILSPYPDLPTAVALVRWGHLWQGECVQPAAMLTWILQTDGDSPELVPMPGGYDQLWLGNWP